jgi:hypothetical protein
MNRREKLEETEGVLVELMHDLSKFGLNDRELAMVFGGTFVSFCRYKDLDSDRIYSRIIDSYDQVDEEDEDEDN